MWESWTAFPHQSTWSGCREFVAVKFAGGMRTLGGDFVVSYLRVSTDWRCVVVIVFCRKDEPKRCRPSSGGAKSRNPGPPLSVLYPPDPKKAKQNTGYVMVAVTSCCNGWERTEKLLQTLLAMDDPIHVVLVDDNSQDGAQEKAAAMGIPVIGTTCMTGNTANMVRAWKYFLSYPQLQTLFILNNDIDVVGGTFTKLNRCLRSLGNETSCEFHCHDVSGT